MFLQVGLGHDQRLLVRRHFGFSPHHLDGGKGADFYLLLIVLQELLGISQSLLLHLHVFLEREEVPIIVQDATQGGDDLLTKDGIGHLDVVLGDADVRRIGAAAKTVQ